MKIKQKYQSGLTLIESLVGIIILGMLGVGLLSLQYILGQNQTLVYQNFINVDEANSAVSQFAKEMRIARPSENGAYVFDTLGDYEIIFYSDIDFDDEAERVRYFLDNTELKRGLIEPVGYPAVYDPATEKVKVLTKNTRNLEAPLFYYYNGDWPNDVANNPLIASERLNQTRSVKVYLRVNNVPDEPDKDFILELYVQPRMLKDNL